MLLGVLTFVVVLYIIIVRIFQRKEICMKNKIKITALLMAVVLSLTACAGTSSDNSGASVPDVSVSTDSNSSSDNNSSEEETTLNNNNIVIPPETDATTTSKPDDNTSDIVTTTMSNNIPSADDKKTEEEIRQGMFKRSLMDLGNLQRMKKFLEKLENGEEVTIGFIGGSITEGMTAGADLCWAKLTYAAFCKEYPKAKIKYVNAGMSGTPSILGNIRAQRDLLNAKPDIVFVEFAVNDGTEQTYKDSYEALVRTILEQDNDPAVVLYFTVIKSGHTCEKHMSEIGKAYGLPMISLNNVLSVEFEEGRLTWEDYSDDESHPNVWGHEMTKNLMMYMVQQARAKIKEGGIGEIEPLPENWVNSDRFYGMQFVDRENSSPDFNMISAGNFRTDKITAITFPAGWQYIGEPSLAEEMKFTFSGKTLMLVYKCSKSKAAGAFTVTVDGKKTGTYSTHANDGWNNPVAVQVFTGDDKVHEVTIEVADSENDSKVMAEIFGFGFC